MQAWRNMIRFHFRLSVFDKDSATTWQLSVRIELLWMHFVSQALDVHIGDVKRRRRQQRSQVKCKLKRNWRGKVIMSIRDSPLNIFFSVHRRIFMNISRGILHVWGSHNKTWCISWAWLVFDRESLQVGGEEKRSNGCGGLTCPTHQSPGPPECVR